MQKILDPHITPVDLLLHILENANVETENIKFIRLTNTQAEKFLIYYTNDDGIEHPAFVRQHDHENFLFAKEKALNFKADSDKNFRFSVKNNKIEIFCKEKYSVCHKKNSNEDLLFISSQPEFALFWAEDFLKEIREEEHKINSKEDTGEKFSTYVETLHMLSSELQKIVSVLKKFFSIEQQPQTATD